MTSLKFYHDFLSQPARAVGLLLESAQVEHEKCPLNMKEGQHRSEDYGKVCPTREVPCIDDHGFCLFESSAILKYVVRKYQLPDHWYPSDIQRQAKVDEYLGWHSTNLRRGGGMMFFKYVGPKIFGTGEPSPGKLKDLEGALKKSRDMMENYFLKNTKFIGGDEITIADLQAVCELSEFWMAHIDPAEGYPRIAQWLKDVQAAVGQPAFDTVHKKVYGIRDQNVFETAK